MSVKNSVLDTENGFLLYFEAKLDEGLEQLQTAEYYPMLDDAAKQDIREAVLAKVDHITGSYCYSVMADLLKDDNPLAGYDLKFITKAEKKRLCPVITQKLINRKSFRLREWFRMWKRCLIMPFIFMTGCWVTFTGTGRR